MEYSTEEICEILPKILDKCTDLYRNDKEFRYQVDMFGKLITGKVNEMLEENKSVKANAVILACFTGIKAACEDVTKER